MPITKTILLAGYGWFAGIPEGETNNAELIARALDGETLTVSRGDGETVCGHIRSLVVPVVWETAFPQVMTAIEEIQPDMVLAMGTDARISGRSRSVTRVSGTDSSPIVFFQPFSASNIETCVR